jgi:hypothetical protein
MVAKPTSGLTVAPEVAATVDAWGRGVFGAPRNISASIREVQPRDEVLHRVVTHVIRRELSEERTFATERQPSRPKIAFSDVDPFAGTLDTLHANTHHVTTCSTCAAGSLPCPRCDGKQVVSCSRCGGAGKFRNPQTNRMNQCKVCERSGKVACDVCDGSGNVSCYLCRGSGYQRVRLVYAEILKPRVVVVPESLIVLTHPQLLEPRDLAAEELKAFSVEAEVHANGTLDLETLALGTRGIVQQELGELDGRLERVTWQQYTRIAVPRCDVTFEMCGSSGTLTLSGSTLTATSTRESLRPVRRRLVLWPTLVIGLSVAAAGLAGSAMGRSAYFKPSNQVIWLLLVGAAILSVPWTGGLLRAWRPVLRIHGMRKIELALGLMWILLLLAIPIVGATSRPKELAVEDALAAGDVEQARLVLDALVEREGESTSILELEDAVLLAEADAAEGDERLAKLDTIVSNQGTRAADAAALARADRLTKIRGYVNAGLPDEGIAAIDQDFATSWQDDPEIAEERARAEEIRAQRCSDEPCQFIALRAARQAHQTPARAAAFEQLHARLLAALSVEGGEATLTPAQRVHQIDEVAALAGQVLAAQLGDETLSKTAEAAKVKAAAQRAAIAIFGADVDTIRALFPDIRESSENILTVSVEGAELFFTVDSKGICRGIYAVGPTGHRELDSTIWPAERILSQTFGRSMSLAPKKKVSDVASSSVQDKTKIVVRWLGSVPIELRIGDAAP